MTDPETKNLLEPQGAPPKAPGAAAPSVEWHSKEIDLPSIKRLLTENARALGFDALGVASIELADDEERLIAWLDAGFHGEMDYMRRHGSLRSRPQELSPGTVRVLSFRMNNWPGEARNARDVQAASDTGNVSRSALGRP